MMRRKHNLDPEWRIKVDATRRGAMNVMRAIKAGEVDENQLDMLNNFVQFSLALMQMEGPQKWARAKVNAEIMALQREEVDGA